MHGFPPMSNAYEQTLIMVFGRLVKTLCCHAACSMGRTSAHCPQSVGGNLFQTTNEAAANKYMITLINNTGDRISKYVKKNIKVDDFFEHATRLPPGN